MQVLRRQGLLPKDDPVQQVQQRERVDDVVPELEIIQQVLELLVELVEVVLVVQEVPELLGEGREDRRWGAIMRWLPQSRPCTLPCCRGPPWWLPEACGGLNGAFKSVAALRRNARKA